MFILHIYSNIIVSFKYTMLLFVVSTHFITTVKLI